ncbi:hypothetical protein OFR22_04165 [Brachyspira hyodysenteriae]|uniref:Uncharacterized protein n=2 Tax=Brachyspira hyodysenteriae TaxID=159 RepID=A0A3B6V9P0_BRAHW|nr:hypothetical protein [Brachyspira hyodysenteriae]ACN84512.1 hypothetical protein BHWA1_02053 [Brachyspira hyodysenteriae WA1]ANN63408.1 hypothetical protein BHYOB78_05880 [Brachyspira hyodysenteriae ATCC 27164]AUJ50245.1 hypothetical protein BH718_01811 [Brachyspira hyodysenteriae]KLI17146.1 hypothetical protein SU44_04370 [Brachyspira hyodysenteriae]KLI19013.1 hypothetical protein SU45_01755 [Brachyspira hyodysenteriae]
MIFALIRDLEILLSDIIFSGINNIDYSTIEKIEVMAKQFEKTSMNNIKDLLIEFIDSLKKYKTDEDKKRNIKEVSDNISKLEFYIRNALSYEK